MVCASGMGAIASVFLALLGQNDHLLVSDGIYGKTTALVTRQLPRWGISHDVFDPTDVGSLRSLLKPTTKLIFAETLTNPLLRLAELDSLAKVAREAGIPLIVDNTFAPLICRPIEHGASLVVHSVTKMIGGHSDLTLGAVVGDARLVDQARIVATTLGQTGNPFESWLALRGTATLSLRFTRACQTSLALARQFESHPAVARVYYPGLPSHPDSARADRYLKEGRGAIVTIDLGSRARADRFIKATLVCYSLRTQSRRRADHSEPSLHNQPPRPGRRPARKARHHTRFDPPFGGPGKPGRPLAGVSTGAGRARGRAGRLISYAVNSVTTRYHRAVSPL